MPTAQQKKGHLVPHCPDKRGSTLYPEFCPCWSVVVGTNQLLTRIDHCSPFPTSAPYLPFSSSIFSFSFFLFTPHAQRERGKVIGRGVHIYIYIIYIYMSVVEKKI